MENLQTSMSKCKAHWTDEANKAFIELAVEQVLLGNKHRSSFSKTGWAAMKEGFPKKTGLNYEKSQLKNHYNNLRLLWRPWDKLIRERNLGWNAVEKTFSATDSVWDDYIKENPDAAQFRKKTLPFHEELDIIYGGASATVWKKCASSQDNLDLAEDGVTSLEESIPSTPLQSPLLQCETVDGTPGTGGEEVGTRRRRRLEPPSASRRVRKDSRLSELSQALSSLADLARVKLAEGALATDKYSITACIECLKTMKDIPAGSELYLDAVDAFKDPLTRETFIALDPEVRMVWLQRMMSRRSPSQ